VASNRRRLSLHWSRGHADHSGRTRCDRRDAIFKAGYQLPVPTSPSRRPLSGISSSRLAARGVQKHDPAANHHLRRRDRVDAPTGFMVGRSGRGVQKYDPPANPALERDDRVFAPHGLPADPDADADTSTDARPTPDANATALPASQTRISATPRPTRKSRGGEDAAHRLWFEKGRA
jgi:hypothetical protein